MWEKVCGWIPEWEHTSDICIPCHWRASPAKKALINQVDKITHSMGVSLIPQLPQCLLNVPINNVTTVSELEAMHGLNNMDFPLPRLTCTTDYCLICQEPRPILSLQYGFNLMGNSHPCDSHLIILGLFHHRKQRFIVSRIHTFWIWSIMFLPALLVDAHTHRMLYALSWHFL